MLIRRRFAIYIYNMRHSKLTAEEILKAEQAADDRRRSRAKGYKKMRERDAGGARLSNGVIIEWGRDNQVWETETSDGKPITVVLAGSGIPEGMFRLTVGREVRLFNAEEFRRHLRWV